MSPRVTSLVLVVLLAAGCASKRDEIGRVTATNDASVPSLDATEESFPIEGRRVSVTTVPFWDTPMTERGVGTPVALDGVELCVAGARPYGASYASFFDHVGGECSAPSTLGANLVVDGVPANAEVLLSASHPGYRPTLYPATTTLRDFDGTINGDVFQMHLYAEDALAKVVPGADATLGSIEIVMGQCGPTSRGFVCAFLEGATITLDIRNGGAGSAPHYAYGGKVVADAHGTLGGDLVLAKPDLARESTTWFVNLAPGEYTLGVQHPLFECVPWSLPLYGHGGRGPGEIHAPVLPGQTTFIVSACACKDPDAAACPGLESDGGAP